MMGYSLVCGIVLVFVAHQETRAMMKTLDEESKIRAMEARFQQDYPDGIASCTEGLRSRMERIVVEMETLQSVLEKRRNLARILLCLLRPLPQDIVINNMRLDHRSRKLNFDLLVPEERPAGSKNIGEVLADWKNSESLRMEVRAVKSVSSKRSLMGNKPIRIVKFGGDLVGPGA